MWYSPTHFPFCFPLGLQILDSFGNGLCFFLLDLLCVEKGVCSGCNNEVAFSCIRTTAARSVYSKINLFLNKIALKEFLFIFFFQDSLLLCLEFYLGEIKTISKNRSFQSLINFLLRHVLPA